ncbi:B12-binding domain-containing radical SAM protein [Salidesulfovibrio onnuriiensis]|uniref:B12-binding domain-containing radical SAM protein n=1 Tax=Salidesulfovibrio onnuriiensis TaxID=2583823 RepID=UPI0011C95C17|nr:radical SAM protein [Salidesulfovibrio onnuriiensis]
MRVILIHPPPWQIPAPGQDTGAFTFPPPLAGEELKIVDLDFLSIPYGLLSLSAQAKKAGHKVAVLNMSNFLWDTVEDVIRNNPADVYGITGMTLNRRGMAAVAQCVRKHHPEAHVTVGGPHVTALPRETLEHYPFIDSVAIGEGEMTLLDMLERMEEGRSLEGVPGLMWRDENGFHEGPERERIADLDSLVLPHELYPVDVIMTSRGCPGKCTFCASSTIWKRRLKFISVERVLDMIELAVKKHGLRALAIKDDTFTAAKGRALDICRGIRERGLNFLWSCDTRVDYLDEEILYEMRLAGCQRISVGVESANREILANICKRITPEQVIEATNMARKYGFQIRYYMIVGNRGETLETYRESCEFIEKARPNKSVFCILSAVPGTADWEFLEMGGMKKDIFFDSDVASFEYFAGDLKDRDAIWEDVVGNALRDHWAYGVLDRQRVLQRLPGHHAALVEMAEALYRKGRMDQAVSFLKQGLEAGYPLPGLGMNLLACISASAGDLNAARAHLDNALRDYPFTVVKRNLETLNRAMRQGHSGPLELDPSTDFEITLRIEQPIYPTTESFVA